jgi:hypothetical protein
MLLNVLKLYIITICLCILVVEDMLHVYFFEQVFNGGLHQTSERAMLFIVSCYNICLYSILEIRVYFCSNFLLLWFTPCHRSIFLVTELATILGRDSSFRGLECFSPLTILVYIKFLMS